MKKVVEEVLNLQNTTSEKLNSYLLGMLLFRKVLIMMIYTGMWIIYFL